MGYLPINLILYSTYLQGLGYTREVISCVKHRHYVSHLHNNKKLHTSEALKERFWTCARSSYITIFQNQIDSLREHDGAA